MNSRRNVYESIVSLYLVKPRLTTADGYPGLPCKTTQNDLRRILDRGEHSIHINISKTTLLLLEGLSKALALLVLRKERRRSA
ncbi:hypothetical protein [Bordetella tumbae]